MKHCYTTIRIGVLSVLLLCATTFVARSAPTLFEWGINYDSTVYAPGDPLPGFINTSGFDFTTGLGTITATVTSPGSHYFSLFVDHEIDELVNTFFNEYGEEVNLPHLVASQTWEIDEPGYVFGDIYDNFLAGSLDNLNGVPSGSEDDVSMALAWDFSLGEGAAVIKMTVSETPPPGGFYLAQTDPASAYSLYFSSAIIYRSDRVPDGASTLALTGIALAGLAALRRKLQS